MTSNMENLVAALQVALEDERRERRLADRYALATITNVVLAVVLAWWLS
jgi:hypothetical protein